MRPKHALLFVIVTLAICIPGFIAATSSFRASFETADQAERAEQQEAKLARAAKARGDSRAEIRRARQARERRAARRQAREEAKERSSTSESEWSSLLKISLYSTGVGAALLAGGVVYLPIRRLRNRQARDYQLYEVHLSMHDEAKEQDLEDMVEMIGNVISGYPEDRAINGRPFVAFELHYGPIDRGMQWTLAVRCTRQDVLAIDAAISAAYPDVRVGFEFEQKPQPIAGKLGTPAHVLRFRKARDFVYPISTASDKAGSPPIEAIAQAQVNVGTPSSVRIQLIAPGPQVEAIARARYRQHEKRQQNRSVSLDGTRQISTLDDFEMREAMRTQNRGMFWLELQVAAETREAANHIASAVMARRGDNRLHRRLMVLRLPLYRKRFPEAYPPLLPPLSMRSLVSAAEVAHLLELPSARMKGVPVRRLPLPRLPAPPEVARTDEVPVPLPPPS